MLFIKHISHHIFRKKNFIFSTFSSPLFMPSTPDKARFTFSVFAAFASNCRAKYCSISKKKQFKNVFLRFSTIAVKKSLHETELKKIYKRETIAFSMRCRLENHLDCQKSKMKHVGIRVYIIFELVTIESMTNIIEQANQYPSFQQVR